MSAPPGERSRDLAPKVTATSCAALSCVRLKAGSLSVIQPASCPGGASVTAAATSPRSGSRLTGTRSTETLPGPSPTSSAGLVGDGQMRGKSAHATLSRNRAPAGSEKAAGPRVIVVGCRNSPVSPDGPPGPSGPVRPAGLLGLAGGTRPP